MFFLVQGNIFLLEATFSCLESSFSCLKAIFSCLEACLCCPFSALRRRFSAPLGALRISPGQRPGNGGVLNNLLPHRGNAQPLRGGKIGGRPHFPGRCPGLIPDAPTGRMGRSTSFTYFSIFLARRHVFVARFRRWDYFIPLFPIKKMILAPVKFKQYFVISLSSG